MSRRAHVALVLLVAAAVAVTLSRLDLRAIGAALGTMSVRWAAVAALVNFGALAIDATRWRLILSATRRVSFLNAFQGVFVGIAANVVFPFKLGEGVRAYTLAARERLPKTTVLTTVLLDRAMDAVALPLFGAVASLMMPLPAAVLRFRSWVVVAVAASIAAGAVVRGWIRQRRLTAAALHVRPGGTVDHLVDGLRVFDHGHRLTFTLAAALAAWSARAAIVWCMFRAFDLRLPVSAAVGVLTLLYVGIALVATPGNIGTFELATAGALALWDVPAEVGVSLGIAMHALEVIPPASFGIAVILRRRDLLWPRTRRAR